MGFATSSLPSAAPSPAAYLKRTRPPLSYSLVPGDEPPSVWPYAEGAVHGYALKPLHKNASQAALGDPALYELLALIDALRDGRSRERALAATGLKSWLD
jgi:hypothetical protein